jgi:hypothetical protein
MEDYGDQIFKTNNCEAARKYSASQGKHQKVETITISYAKCT